MAKRPVKAKASTKKRPARQKSSSASSSSASRARTRSARTLKKAPVTRKRTTALAAKTRTAPEPETPPATRTTRLSKADLQLFRQLLIEHRARLSGDVNNMTDEALGRNQREAAGNLSAMPIHMADLGSDNFEQEFTLNLIDNERHLLKEIDEALERIDKGTYGVCQATGKPITKARLRAKPWARHCIEYARMLEKGQVPRQ